MKEPWWARVRDELLRIRYRLLLVNALIVSVPIVGIGFARVYEREQLRALEEDMVHQAQVLRELILSHPEILATGPAQAGEPRRRTLPATLVAIARHTRARIRLLDATGKLVADSHADGPPEGRSEQAPRYPGRSVAEPPARTAADPPPEDPARRPEVKAALEGRYGSSTRIWTFADGERVFLFSALPVNDGGGKTLGVIYVTRSTLPVLAALYRLRTSLFKLLVAALAATAVLSLFLAATIARPLSRLARIARRIAAGDRSQSLALGRHDEIGHLARAFDALTRKLDDRARAAAQMAADISHEFKSPLTSIRGAAELLLDGAAEDPRARRRFLGNILEDAGRLDRLVSRLLELSRLEADEAPFEAIPLGPLVADAVAATGPASVPVIVEERASALTVWGRPGQLGSALRNLIENARQHAAPGTPVRVALEDAAGGIRVAVHNHGAPISPSNLGRIWDRFFTTRVGAGGSGLGLPIVAAAVAAHGGRTFVRSDAREGTTFGFELPVGRAG
jgi:two-component system sensor histidine kinase ChvG